MSDGVGLGVRMSDSMHDNSRSHVMIVDDNQDLRTALRYMLQDLGDFDFTEAADGQSALDKFALTKFDLVFLDLNLPLVHGSAVLSMISVEPDFNTPGYLVVLSGASNLERFISQPAYAHVDSYLTKPFLSTDIQATLVAAGI